MDWQAQIEQVTKLTGEWLTRNGLSIAAILLFTWLGSFLSQRLIDKLFTVLSRAPRNTSASARFNPRARTLSVVLKSGLKVALWAMALLTILPLLNIQTGPLLASVGILGLALSFGAQNLIRDIIGGFFILLEDQYGVGDVISVNKEHTGAVENITLRATWLRNLNGEAIIIPNGVIQVVYNMSREWAQAVLDIPVPYSENLDQVINLLQQTADQIWQSSPGQVLERPEVLGVHDFGASAVVVRVVLKTAPLEQWNIARKFRLHIHSAFRREGITIPFPQMDVWVKNQESGDKRQESGIRNQESE